jgi:arylformamidase
MLYRSLRSQQEIDREYNPRLTLGEDAANAYLASYKEESRRVRETLAARLDVPYGPSPAETLDIFPAPDHGGPIHVFIHGGYWRAFTSKDFSFVAEAPVADGTTAVVVNYALCPEVTIDEIVRQCRVALAWVWRNAPGYGDNPAQLTVSGHSAGGHLTAMLLATDWREWGLPGSPIRAAMPISGLYDLGPFPHSFLQPSLNLDAAQVERNSPMFLTPLSSGPALVAVGAEESAEFHRQAWSYADHLEAHGIAVERHDLAGRNHFSVLDEFRGRGGAALRALLRRGRG